MIASLTSSMPRQSVRSSFTKNLGIVGSVVASLSIVSLVSSGFNVGWTEPFRKVLEQYFVITNNIKFLIEPHVVPLLQWTANTLGIRLSLGPNWADLLLLMMVYLGSRVKAYASEAKYVRTAFMSLTAFAISIICASFGSTEQLLGWHEAFVATAIPLLGFLIYDFIYACVGATLDRRTRVSWLNDFIRHLRFSVPLLVFCLLVNMALTILLTNRLGATGYQAFVLAFLVNYVLIATYWALRSYQHARSNGNRNLGESIAQRFWRSSATVVSVNVAVVIVSGALFMLGNAGLRAAGTEFSHFKN